jgi:DNA-binding transcriptional LysR family regulator
MLDVNHLFMFSKVAQAGSFSAAARALGVPKSNVSRAVALLEAELGARLFQRTTRKVTLTEIGRVLRDRSVDLLDRLTETVEYVNSLSGTPRGHLKVSAGTGFGINVLSVQLPRFLERYPQVTVTLDLESGPVDILGEEIDVAIRFGPLPDSRFMATRLGMLNRYLCATPAYIGRRGTPATIADLDRHDLVEMPGDDGRARPWRFRRGDESVLYEVRPRVCVTEALTSFGLVAHGAGIGVASSYLCGPLIQDGRLIRVLPEWSLPPLEVSLVFPSRRELAPTVRAFIDFMKECSPPTIFWQEDALGGATR